MITREYKGRLLEVLVLDEGFEYAGEKFKSLSAVAKRITGSHCNGYLFFNLRRRGDWTKLGVKLGDLSETARARAMEIVRKRIVPAALRTFFLRVVPVRAAFAVEGEFDQTEAHHQVAHHLGLDLVQEIIVHFRHK